MYSNCGKSGCGVSFNKKDLKKLKKNLKVYGGTSRRVVCDACGRSSVVHIDLLSSNSEDKKDDDEQQKIYCPKCGKVIRTTDF